MNSIKQMWNKVFAYRKAIFIESELTSLMTVLDSDIDSCTYEVDEESREFVCIRYKSQAVIEVKEIVEITDDSLKEIVEDVLQVIE